MPELVYMASCGGCDQTDDGWMDGMLLVDALTPMTTSIHIPLLSAE